MSRPRRRYYLIGTLALIAAFACAPFSNIGLPSGDGNFPRTPNPLAVHAILDTERAVDIVSPGWVFGMGDGVTADGVEFSLLMPGGLLSQDADGNLASAFGSVVTMTPVSAIDDIPFSQGYLAAVHIGPDGLLITSPGTLSMTLQGVYDVSQLIGFAADGTGEDFHLFPISVYSDSYSGTTSISFYIAHFSLYGVALATLQEIEAQKGHPPVSPASQDEEELAPLTPLLGDEELAPCRTSSRSSLINPMTGWSGAIWIASQTSPATGSTWRPTSSTPGWARLIRPTRPSTTSSGSTRMRPACCAG